MCLYYRYEEFQKKKTESDSEVVENIRDCLFYMTCLMPVGFSLFELLSLHWYRLNNRHLSIGSNRLFNVEERLLHL